MCRLLHPKADWELILCLIPCQLLIE